MGLVPGLTGTTKVEAYKVGYTAGNTLRYRSLRVPHPRFDWNETALEFNFIFITEVLV